MDPPPIQYVRTTDGVNIAYWRMGEGPALVHLPLNLAASHIQRETAMDVFAAWYERLSAARTLVRLDTRGCGLSDHDVARLDLDHLVADVAAVVGALDVPQVALFGGLASGPVAVAAAAAHPERVSHLVLWCATLGRWGASTPGRAMAALRAVDPAFAGEALRRMGIGLGEDARALVRFLNETAVPTTRMALGVEPFEAFDVTALAPQVQAQTLVLWPSDSPLFPLDLGRDTAALLPGATLRVIQGDSQSPLLSQAPAIADAIDEFVGGRETTVPEGFRTILFTDLAASTATTQRLGDAAAQAIVRAHDSVVRAALGEHRGHEIKHTGDGIMAWFGSASAALDCALAIQRGVADLTSPDVRLKIGVNAGEPIAEAGDLFGTAVQIAARVTDAAAAGEIVCTNVVRELVAGRGYVFSARGAAALKGIQEPVPVYTLERE